MYLVEQPELNNSIYKQSNVITCCSCERNFIYSKTATPNYCPHCGKQLGRRVKFYDNETRGSG